MNLLSKIAFQEIQEIEQAIQGMIIHSHLLVMAL